MQIDSSYVKTQESAAFVKKFISCTNQKREINQNCNNISELDKKFRYKTKSCFNKFKKKPRLNGTYILLVFLQKKYNKILKLTIFNIF